MFVKSIFTLRQGGILKGQAGLGPKVAKKSISFLKRLPISKNRYYRYFGTDAMESYRKLGKISQFDEFGVKASAYDYPMFSKGYPGLEYVPKTGYIAISKPKSLLPWVSVSGRAVTPIVGGQYNLASVSEFDFYRRVPGKGFVKLDENLNMPEGLKVSDTPHIDYLKTLDEPQQIDFLNKAGLNKEWLWTLKNNPEHLQNALWDKNTPKITLDGITY